VKILFDQGTPVPLRRALIGHEVITAYEKGWANLENGSFIQAAEAEGFAALITTDKNLRYQQNLTWRRLAILVLWTTNWPELQRHTATVALAVNDLKPGEYRELEPQA
jgi:hypothetical protein